jgi:peptidyl-prolyl cis-trans isomerase D
MLKQLRRLKRTRNTLLIGFAILTTGAMVFFGPGMMRGGNSVDPARDTTVIAKVSGEEITVADVAQLRDSYMQMFGGQMSLDQLGGNKRILDGLIRDRVVSQEAARLNLAASNEELKQRLFKQFTDPSGKFVYSDGNKVDVKKYQEAINNRYGGVERFERGVRDAIAQEKLRALVTASVSVSPEEIQDEFKRKNTDFDLTYTAINAEKLAEKIQPSDQDLQNHYAQHKEEYRINEPQKKIRYVFIDQEKSGLKLQIPDKDLHDEFDKLPADAKRAGFKVQQMLLKVARKDLDSQVEQKGKDLINKLRGPDGTVTEKAFADIARGQSEDPATAKNGGSLARVIKKNPNKPDGLYDRIADMQLGEVSDIPIKYAGNYYILRRGEEVPKTFDEAKPELLVSLRNRRSYAVAASLAQRAAESLKKSHDPQKVAQELAGEANMSAAEMVRETPYIKQGDDVPNIGSNQQFEAAIAGLNNPNDVGNRIGVKGGFAIPMFVAKKDPRVPEFDEIKDKLAKDYKQQKAKEQLDQKVKDLAASVNSAADLKAAVEKAGFEAKTDESYKKGRSLEKLAASEALDQTIYGMKEGEVTKSPIKIGDSWIIVGVNKRREADLAEFAKQREQLTETALRGRQDQVYEDYIAAAMVRMKNEGKVKIYQDVLTKMDEDTPESAAPPPPRRSFPIPTR